MTLIMSIVIDGQGILIGDAMLSMSEAARVRLAVERKANLPMMGDFDFEADGGGVPISLRQKICLLDDNLAVAWCGDLATAERVIGSIYEYIKDKKVSYQVLSEWSSFHGYHGDDVDGIIMLHEDGKISVWGGDEIDLTLWGFESVRFSGTGSGFVMPLLTGEGLSSDMIDVLGNSLGGAGKAVPYGLFLSGALLGCETLEKSFDFFDYYFGGAYEVCFFNGKKFEKIDDVLYVFFNATVHVDGSIDLDWFPTIFKSDYVGENLFIKVIECEWHKDRCKTKRIDLHEIRPLIRINQVNVIPHELKFSSKYLVYAIAVHGVGISEILSFVAYPNDEVIVRPIEGQSQFEIRFSADFFEKTYQGVRDFMSSHPDREASSS
jgi:hypothetical protein